MISTQAPGSLAIIGLVLGVAAIPLAILGALFFIAEKILGI
jgi:hypothetical protein